MHVLTESLERSMPSVPGVSSYFDVVPLVDAVGFAVKRRYPASSFLSSPSPNGKPNYVALLQIVVKKPSVPHGLARVIVSVQMYDTWARESGLYDYRNPACPPADVVAAVKVGAHPRTVIEDARFFYDPMDGSFYRAGPTPVTIDAILDELYDTHCRTLQWQFRLRWAITTTCRALVASAAREREVTRFVRTVRLLRPRAV